MSDTKHTPGPWEVKKLIADQHGIILYGGWEIWTPDYSVVTERRQGAPIRNEADAVLIAAAPDLLAALESVPEPPHCDGLSHVDRVRRENCDVCNRRRWYDGPRAAALAKAKVRP